LPYGAQTALFVFNLCGVAAIVTLAVLNEFLSTFDELAQQHGLRPIRTTGDSYLVLGGLPVPRPDHAQAVANMALDMLDGVKRLNEQHGWAVGFRIGVNSAPAMAAVVGHHRFTYDIWSDTVNAASRMESSGVLGRIQVTEGNALSFVADVPVRVSRSDRHQR